MRVSISLVLLLSMGCMGASMSPDEEGANLTGFQMEPSAVAEMEDLGYAADGVMEGKKERRSRGAPPAKPMAAPSDDAPAPPPGVAEEEPADKDMDGEPSPDDDGGEQQARKWFPESFLWQPIVETDAQGQARVPVRVPDQLTTWRVLALAHSREGRQAGAVHTFDSRLPLYVDPVVPGWLYVGDKLQLPVQAVNTTNDPLSGTLRVEGSDALSGAAEASVTLDPGASAVRAIRLDAIGAGSGMVRADLRAGGEGDAAERSIPVLPQGRPVQRSRGGTLSLERKFSMTGPKGADPITQELSVLVFPGPLAVLQAEVDRLGRGAVPPDGAYGFALARSLGQLSASSGVDTDPKAVRKLRLLAWQRVVHAARAPDHGIAADLLLSLGEDSGFELADAMRPRLVATLVGGQRGDGTWARQGNGSLQVVLTQTAYAARALPEDATGARLRASGAIERYSREIKDPFTAAVVLSSGLATGQLADHLQQLVIEGASESPSGAYTVSIPADTLNAWGYRPSQAEMLAWTTLALADVDVPWKGDLVAELMGGWHARYGFGAGAADAIALEAVTNGLPGVSKPVEVALFVGGVEASSATLDPSQPKVPAVLMASPNADAGDIVLRADPEVPGLAFVATLASWVPWTGDEVMEGVEIEVSASAMNVGRDSVISISVSAPSKEVLTLVQGLPAGATVDVAQLGGLSSMITNSDVSTDRVTLTTRPFNAGEVMNLEIRVQPAFAGRFTTLPFTVRRANGSEVFLPPLVWTVAGPGGA